MWRITSVLLISLLSLGNGESQIQPSQSAPQVQTKEKPNGSMQNQEKPKLSESNLPVTPPPAYVAIPNSGETTKDSQNGDEDGTEFWSPFSGYRFKITDTMLVLFTFVLAIFTGLLWLSTNEGGKLLPKIERAYVFGKVELRNPIVSTNEGTALSQAIAMFINHGKTPAIIINMSGTHYVSDIVPQQFTPTRDDDRRLPEGWVIASGGSFDRPIDMHISNKQMDAINEGRVKLYCAGMIRYKDILGDERYTGYCWEYLPSHGRFQFCKDSHLNKYA